jgi:hypothetical protein
MMEMKSASEFLVLLSKITGAEIKYPCPGCGYLVFDEPPGSYEICPICFWEDDLAQLRFLLMSWGANRMSLIESQENYFRDGVSELRFPATVRTAVASDVREPQWRRRHCYTWYFTQGSIQRIVCLLSLRTARCWNSTFLRDLRRGGKTSFWLL